MAPSLDEIDSEAEKMLLNSDSDSNTGNITSNIALVEMKNMLQKILQNQCTKTDLKSFSENVSACFDGIDERLASQEDNITKITKRLDECENVTVNTAYQLELEKQRALKNNISLFGIPKNNNENLIQIVVTMLQSKIGCAVATQIIKDCYRIKGNGNHIIIAKLSDFDLKQKVLANKSNVKVTLGNIISCSSSQANTPIFINNHTTPFFGKLLSEGRKAAKDGKVHSCWLNSFGCQLKFSKEGKHFEYRNSAELQKLIEENIKDGKTNSNKRSLSPAEGMIGQSNSK